MPYKNKEDQAASGRRHYEANKEKIKARAIEHRKNIRKQIQNLVRESKQVPCADCGESYPSYVMDFDHRGDKAFNVGAWSRHVNTVNAVRAEIDKCDIVCANCHRERTFGQKSATT